MKGKQADVFDPVYDCRNTFNPVVVLGQVCNGQTFVTAMCIPKVYLPFEDANLYTMNSYSTDSGRDGVMNRVLHID